MLGATGNDTFTATASGSAGSVQGGDNDDTFNFNGGTLTATVRGDE